MLDRALPQNSALRNVPRVEIGPVPAAPAFLNIIGVVLAFSLLALAVVLYLAWLFRLLLVRFIVWCCANLLFKIRIVGADHIPRKGAALIVSNHVSYADAILIGCATPRFIRFLMWRPLYENKWLYPFNRLLYAIPIPTRSPKESLRALRNARTELEKGRLVGIFPEGEITRTSQVKPFERGVEVITRGIESTPVLPVYLDGLWGHAFSLKGGRLFASSLKLRHPVTVYIGEPIAGQVDAESLRQRVLEAGGKPVVNASSNRSDN